MRTKLGLFVFVLLFVLGRSYAQTASENYRIFEDTFSTGGKASTSQNYVVEDVIGDTVRTAETVSESFTLDPGYKTDPTFRFEGFFEPVENPPALNAVNAGSSVAIKWRLRDAGGNLLTDTTTIADGYPRYVSIDCAQPNEENRTEIKLRPSKQRDVRWDASSEQFVITWKTPRNAENCVRFEVLFVDGMAQSALFRFD